MALSCLQLKKRKQAHNSPPNHKGLPQTEKGSIVVASHAAMGKEVLDTADRACKDRVGHHQLSLILLFSHHKTRSLGVDKTALEKRYSYSTRSLYKTENSTISGTPRIFTNTSATLSWP